MKFTITSEQILGFCAFVGAIWGTWKIIMELKKPNDDLKNAVDSHAKMLTNDKEEIENLKKESTIVLQSQLVMIQHMIDGNGIQGLKEQRDKIQEYLINR